MLHDTFQATRYNHAPRTKGAEMAWATVVVLALLTVSLSSLYERSLREARALANFAVLLLLDDDVNSNQRAGLQQLLISLNAIGAVDLGFKVNMSLSRLALSLEDTMLDVAGMLWNLKG
jgi:hypothetical protein